MDIMQYVEGNLGGDVELKFVKDNLAIANFSLGYTPTILKNGEREKGETMWFRVAVFGEDAEAIADTLKKGDAVCVWGEFKQSSYVAKDGTQKTSLDIKAKRVSKPVRATRVLKQVKQEEDWKW